MTYSEVIMCLQELARENKTYYKYINSLQRIYKEDYYEGFLEWCDAIERQNFKTKQEVKEWFDGL